jgi:hypothetical protein
MVTIIGFVPSRNDKPPDLPEARYFAVETSVYDTSKAASVAFSVTCFLENTKRWQRVKILLDFTNYTTCHKNGNPHLEQCTSGLYLTDPSGGSIPQSHRQGRWPHRRC